MGVLGPRHTIGRFMVLVACAAVLLWLLRDADGVPFAIALGGLTLALASWASVRGQRRSAAIWFCASAIVANGAAALFCIYEQGGWWAGLLFTGLLGCIPPILGFGVAWSAAASQPKMEYDRPPLAAWPSLLAKVLVLAMAISPLVTLFSYWPLRVAFLISRPALASLADRVAAGQSPPFPIRAGLYRIVDAVTDPTTGNIALITNPNRSGRSGFVRYQPRASHGPFSSLFMSIDLDWTWAFEMED